MLLLQLPPLPSGFKERPDAQCESLLRYMLHEGAWLPQHRLAACENIDMPYFQHRVADALDIRNVLTYAHGSCTADIARIAHNKVLSHLYTATGDSTNATADASTNAPDCVNMKSSDLSDSTQCWYSHTERSRILPSGTHNVVALSALNVEDPNSALLTFMQVTLLYLSYIVMSIMCNLKLYYYITVGGDQLPSGVCTAAATASAAERARLHGAAHQAAVGLHCIAVPRQLWQVIRHYTTVYLL